MTKVLEPEPVAASPEERSTLRRIKGVIEAGLQHEEGSAPRLVGRAGEEIVLPEALLHILRQAVACLADEQAVTVVPVNKALTTQEAADLLNVSRPYLIKLLDEGVLPYSKTGTHRRIPFAALMVYKRQQDARQWAALDELTRLSQELGLYDA